MGTLAGFTLFWMALGTDGLDHSEAVVYRDGTIKVTRREDRFGWRGNVNPGPEYTLFRDGISRGTNHLKPADPRQWNDPRQDFSRYATTYYHRHGPLGVALDKLNWFPDPRGNNTFHADARLPASLVGLAAGSFGGPVPADVLVGAWSEPPLAVVNMYAGTPASYARPLQVLHFYESDPAVVRLSLPKTGEPLFRYVADARRRGAAVEVFRGDERPTLARGPERFYHLLVVELCPRDRLEDISVELLTREGLQVGMGRLAEEGVLCYHVSNRYIDVEPVLADVARDLGLACRVGRDWAPDAEPGHYSSQWVMVARRREYLDHLKPPPGHEDRAKQMPQFRGWGAVNEPYWQQPPATGRHLWTDKSRHGVRGLLRSDPLTARWNDEVRRRLTTLYRAAGGRSSFYPAPLEPFNGLVTELREALDQDVRAMVPPRRPQR